MLPVKGEEKNDKTTSLLVTDPESLNNYHRIINSKRILHVDCNDELIKIPLSMIKKICMMATADYEEMSTFVRHSSTVIKSRAEIPKPVDKQLELNPYYKSAQKLVMYSSDASASIIPKGNLILFILKKMLKIWRNLEESWAKTFSIRS